MGFFLVFLLSFRFFSYLECFFYEYNFNSFFFRDTLSAYGGSQARDQIRAIAAGLHHSHSNVGSEPCLRPAPQLMATPDP